MEKKEKEESNLTKTNKKNDISKLQVSKSKNLVWTKYNNWGTREMDMFEIYLAKINPKANKDTDDPESAIKRATVSFTIKEFEEMTGKKERSMSTKEVQQILDNMVKAIAVFDKENNTYITLPLFRFAKAEFDKDIGKTKITIIGNVGDISETDGYSVEKYFFNLQSTGYIKYRLQSVLKLKSTNAKKLYAMLKNYCYGNYTWITSVDDLKSKLDIKKDSYKKFSEFNRSCLSQYVKQINKVTDINVEYETKREGRFVKYIIFHLRYKSEQELENYNKKINTNSEESNSKTDAIDVEYKEINEFENSSVSELKKEKAASEYERLKEQISDNINNTELKDVPNEDNKDEDIYNFTEEDQAEILEVKRKSAKTRQWLLDEFKLATEMYVPKIKETLTDENYEMLIDLVFENNVGVEPFEVVNIFKKKLQLYATNGKEIKYPIRWLIHSIEDDYQ